MIFINYFWDVILGDGPLYQSIRVVMLFFCALMDVLFFPDGGLVPDGRPHHNGHSPCFLKKYKGGLRMKSSSMDSIFHNPFCTSTFAISETLP